MKIIDEKGRLFGKINVIDFLVILFLLSLTPMFYFGYKLSTSKKELMQREQQAQQEPLAQQQVEQQKPKEFIEITIPCNFIEVPAYLLPYLKVGVKQIDEKGKVVGEIIWVGESRPFQHAYNLGTDEDGKLKKIKVEDPKLKQLAARLKLTVEVRDPDLYYNNWRIQLGSWFLFTTDLYSYRAMPIESEKGKIKS